MWKQLRSILKRPSGAVEAQNPVMMRAISGYAEDMASFDLEDNRPKPIEVVSTAPTDGPSGTMEAAAQSPAAPETDVTEIGHPEEDADPLGDQAIQLVLNVPPFSGGGESWIGGEPRLPVGVAWPVDDGTPMMFLCQIACRDLAEGVWGRNTPETGSLAFFIGAAEAPAVAVMHVEEDAAVRSRPEGLATENGWCAGKFRGARVPAAFADYEAPRWPVQLITEEGRKTTSLAVSIKYARDDNPRWRTEAAASPEDPALEPFDWTSAKMMLAVGRNWIEAAAERLDTPNDLAEAELLARHQDAIAEITRIEDDIARLSETDPFGAASWYPAFGELCQIADPTDEDTPENPAPGVVELSGGADGWLVIYDLLRSDYAKRLYAEDPDCIPEPARAHFEKLWRFDVEFESGWIGGVPRADYGITSVDAGSAPEPDTAAEDGQEIVLLELPTSEFFGWSFGDLDSLLISMPREDLADLDFSRATARISR